MNRIGIDLGTTNTVVAVEDRVLGIADDGGTNLPSVVAFLPNGRVQTGATARRRRSIDGANTIFSSKRIIGRRYGDGITREFRERYPFDLVDIGADRPGFRTRAGVFTPVDIASILLGQVYERVAVIADDIDVVITVPTGFGDSQRDATSEAADKAGFGNVRLMDEPTATAYAYRSDPDVRGCVAIYDLGGGTFDVSIVDLSSGAPRLLARASDPFLGGDDIDHKIAEWVAREVLKERNWDLKNYAEVEVRLLAECERAKIRLSDCEETTVDLTQIDPECPAADEGLRIRRGIMDELAGQLVRRTFIVCDDALREADMRAGDLGAVLLAGGSTHLQVVRDGAAAYFGREPLCDIEATEVVARGASLASG